MRCLYFDCFSGASGDMIVGALLDLGVQLAELEKELAKLGLAGYTLSARRVTRSHLSATKFDVQFGAAGHTHEPQPVDQPHAHDHSSTHAHAHSHGEPHHHHDHEHHEPHEHDHSHQHDHAAPHAHEHRSLATIEQLIEQAGLAPRVQDRARRIFRRLGKAEAQIHNIPIEEVHFHEVGAIDSIVDIVGACIGFELLGIERFFASPLNVGYGMVKCAHGLLPVPAPATARLLEQAPVYTREGQEGELVTPTGAAIISTLCESYGPLPALKISGTGYGAGSRDFAQHPNLLRLVLGEVAEAAAPLRAKSHGHGDVVVIETNIDDMTPQVFGYLLDKVLAAGALDVYYTPVQMKKNRPGILLTVLCEADKFDALTTLIFRETTTIGLRHYTAGRKVLARERLEVTTPYGLVNIKVARLNGQVVNYSAEYDDCRAAAERSGVALREVQLAAQLAFEAWLEGHKP